MIKKLHESGGNSVQADAGVLVGLVVLGHEVGHERSGVSEGRKPVWEDRRVLQCLNQASLYGLMLTGR